MFHNSYFLILALQAFCIFHAVRNKKNYYWIFIILFLPLIGCIIYLVTQVFNKRDIDKVQNTLTTIVNPTKQIKDLQKQIDFVDTFQNRLNLADAYFNNKDYTNAITQYQHILGDDAQNDYYITAQLATCNYKMENYNAVLKLAKTIQNNSNFKASNIQFLYGMALSKLNRVEEAQQQLLQIDQRYSNYNERLVLIKFLFKHEKNNKANEILTEMLTETQHMTKPNKKKYKAVIRELQMINEKMKM